MGLYIGYRDGGKTDEEGFKKELSRLFSAGVALTHDADSLKVTQRAAGANMSVDVAIGDVHLYTPDETYSFWGFTDTITNVSITAADPTNPRIDAIVAYIDMTVVSSALSNNPGALKIVAIAGTPAGSPSTPSDGTIQSTIGGANGFQRLANVTVNAATSSITNGVITDARSPIQVLIVDGQIGSSAIADSSIITQLIASNAVTKSKLEQVHTNSLLYSTGGALGGWVSQAQITAPYDTIDTAHAYGITGVTGSNAHLVIARDGMYNITLQENQSDGTNGVVLIVWLKFSFDNGSSYLLIREYDRILNINNRQVYSWQYWLPAGAWVGNDIYTSSGSRHAGYTNDYNGRYYSGPKLTVTEIR